jgi:hypothetical protein
MEEERFFAEEAERFAAFCQTDFPSSGGVTVLFFSSGLLNIVAANYDILRRTRAATERVVITSGLSADERKWVDDAIDFATHHIECRADDKTVWEWLFAVSTCDITWQDIDCFVFDDSVFDELSLAAMTSGLASVYSRQFGEYEFGATPLCTVSRRAISAVNSLVPTSPCTYSVIPSPIIRFAPHSYSRVLTPEHVLALQTQIPITPGGDDVDVPLPGYMDIYSDGSVYASQFRGSGVCAGKTRAFGIFDTLVVFELVARLANCPRTTVDRTRTGFDRCFHVGGISYHQSAHGPTNLPSSPWLEPLCFDYLLMERFCDQWNLRGYNDDRRQTLREQIVSYGFSRADASAYCLERARSGLPLAEDFRSMLS